MSKFKVGDKVRIVKGSYRGTDFSGRLGIVITGSDPNNSLYCTVKFPDGETAPFNGMGMWNDIVEVIEDCKPCESRPKFKVGDEIEFIGIDHGVWNGKVNHEFGITNDRGEYFNPDVNQEDFWDSIKFIRFINRESNEVTNTSQNKVGEIMSNITKFVKNLSLSADEKLLRKHGFKNECGEYTLEGRDFAILKTCEVHETAMIEVAKGLEAEAKENK